MSQPITDKDKKLRDFLLGKKEVHPVTGETLAEKRKSHEKAQAKQLEAEKAKEQEMSELREKNRLKAEANLEKEKLARTAKVAEPVKEPVKVETKTDAKATDSKT